VARSGRRRLARECRRAAHALAARLFAAQVPATGTEGCVASLGLAAVEAGTLPLLNEAVAIDAVLNDLAHWVSAPAQATDVRLHAEPVAGWVRADARRLRQILVKLASNAVNYNNAGGQVWLVAQAVGDATDAGWTISVSDDGRSLTAAQCAHPLESFNRLGADREGIEGTGIGLVIVRRLADFIGGRITVQSEAGHGNTFSVWLPRADAPVQGQVAAPTCCRSTCSCPTSTASRCCAACARSPRWRTARRSRSRPTA
jgi:signal transduction histidine kinase